MPNGEAERPPRSPAGASVGDHSQRARSAHSPNRSRPAPAIVRSPPPQATTVRVRRCCRNPQPIELQCAARPAGKRSCSAPGAQRRRRGLLPKTSRVGARPTLQRRGCGAKRRRHPTQRTDGLQRSCLAARACGAKRRQPQPLRPGDLDVPSASTEEIQLSSSIAVLDVDF